MTAQEKFENMVRVIPYVPTSVHVALTMLSGIEITATTRILEPSAGTGSLVNIIREHSLHLIDRPDVVHPHIDMCELDEERAKHLFKTQCIFPNTRLVGRDFLELMPIQFGARLAYDVVLMNPPFSHKYEELDHIIHAFALLADNGVLVSVVPREYSNCTTENAMIFNKILSSHQHCYIDLPNGSFMPYSNTPSKLIKIWK